MKNLFIKIAIVITAISVISAVYSYEDGLVEQNYLNSIKELNHSIASKQSDKKLLLMPDFVCGILREGQTADDAVYAVVFDQKKRNDETFIYGAIVVKYSVEYFCPEFQYQVDSWVK